MMMKSKIYYMLTALLLAAGMTSCSLKEDDDFGTSASQRSQDNLNDITEVLQTAQNGWLVQYYANLSFGGYNVMMKFHGDSVTIGSEQWGPNHVAGLDDQGQVITTTSHYTHYKTEQSMGSVLSFDEYNETFHYYSMPNNPDYSYDKDDGLLGDFEFRVMSASPDSIVLRGKKHNNRILMTPIADDVTWESIITDAKETEEYMQSRSYTLTGEARTDTIDITVTNNGSYRCLIFQYKDSLDASQVVTAPYIVDKNGYTFYRAVEVNGMTLDGLDKGDTDDYFFFRNNRNLQLDSAMPTLVESLTTGTWYQRYGSVGEAAKPAWDAMLAKLKTAGKNKDEIKIYTATIGMTSDEKLACSMTTSTDAPYWGFTFESKNDEGTRIKFNQNSTVNNKAGKTYRKSYAWDKVLNTIYGHTFDLTCDYQRRPTWITMTDVNDPTNVITVYVTPSYFMEDPNYYQDK